ncbi:acyl-CoA dehydrogenase FadE29 [Mycolicibacterium fortuitum]|uniref:Acyl-CoA dehydrogenase FadE29 n=1 Tax=Mycolicibacterium fortuitum TaxID=1766 RepID=A0A378UW70_MYCFO|nr:acyl-CoA dehydrogenase FadE29 [Mycolicibacterium fortuitum]
MVTAIRPTRKRAELLVWLDKMTKRNLVITFRGGVNEVMREMIAASGLRVARGPDERSAGGIDEIVATGRSKPTLSRDACESAHDSPLGRRDRRQETRYYVDEEAAKPPDIGIVAPPAMIQVWTMDGPGPHAVGRRPVGPDQ